MRRGSLLQFNPVTGSSIVHVGQGKQAQLDKRMAQLGIVEPDLEERFVLGSGSGGQKVNKTSSCVQLRHKPTGIDVKCQRTRSRALNRYHARRELCERLAERLAGERSERRRRQEKIRRQKRRRSRRQKERMLEAKHRQGAKKRLRQRVSPDA